MALHKSSPRAYRLQRPVWLGRRLRELQLVVTWCEGSLIPCCDAFRQQADAGQGLAL